MKFLCIYLYLNMIVLYSNSQIIKIKYAIIRIVQFMKVKWRSIAIIIDIWSVHLFKFLKRPVSEYHCILILLWVFNPLSYTLTPPSTKLIFIHYLSVFLSVTYFHRRRNSASPQNLFFVYEFLSVGWRRQIHPPPPSLWIFYS